MNFIELVNNENEESTLVNLDLVTEVHDVSTVFNSDPSEGPELLPITPYTLITFTNGDTFPAMETYDQLKNIIIGRTRATYDRRNND